MKVNKAKSIILLSVIVTLFVAGSVANQPGVEAATTTFFTLTYKAYAGNPYPDYANFVKQHLARIGINVDIVLEDWGAFLDTLLGTRDFDITNIGFGGGGADFFGLPQSAFRENSSLNCFGYDITMDYDDTLGTGLNEWYIKEGNLIMPPDSEERIQHAWDWQDYMQTEILPMKPLFAPLGYVAYWNNLQGYNYSDGVRRSWGKMSWDGLHPGQNAANEIVLTDSAWSELNPFFYSDGPSGTIIGYNLDSTLSIDADLSIWPELAEGWDFVDDTTLDLFVRDDVYWPDYGIFTNQKVTADDFYFTYYCWQELSVRYSDWYWLADFEKIDDMTIRLYIDGDPDTPTPDAYAPSLIDAGTWICPEHFLNQTQEADGVTPDITHPSWTDYSTNVWGTDIFQIDDYTESVETVLSINPNSWHFDTAVTSDPDLNYEERFGDYSGGLDTLIMRIIPDPQTSLLEFEAGKVDIDGVSHFQNKRDQYLADPTKDLQSDTTNFFNWFGYNMREARGEIGSRDPCPLDPSLEIGLAVRKAISYAIDRSEMNQVLHNNENVIWDYPNYPTLGIWNNPNIIRYNFDLDKAREFMTKAGFDLGWVPPTPGFTLPITIASLFAIASVGYLIIRRRK
jgi:peptide/nickel transport system substrate-binding protein